MGREVPLLRVPPHHQPATVRRENASCESTKHSNILKHNKNTFKGIVHLTVLFTTQSCCSLTENGTTCFQSSMRVFAEGAGNVSSQSYLKSSLRLSLMVPTDPQNCILLRQPIHKIFSKISKKISLWKVLISAWKAPAARKPIVGLPKKYIMYKLVKKNRPAAFSSVFHLVLLFME